MMPARKTNPHLESVREAYRKSEAYRRIHGGETVPGTVAAALPEKPKVEYRPDMPVDDYQRWIEELAQP